LFALPSDAGKPTTDLARKEAENEGGFGKHVIFLCRRIFLVDFCAVLGISSYDERGTTQMTVKYIVLVCTDVDEELRVALHDRVRSDEKCARLVKLLARAEFRTVRDILDLYDAFKETPSALATALTNASNESVVEGGYRMSFRDALSVIAAARSCQGLCLVISCAFVR